MMAVGLLIALAGLGERVRVEKPWLVAYDAEGHPLWELLATEVEGTSTGWTATEVTVRIFDADGGIAIEAHVAELETDAKGSRWNSTAPVEGKGRNFRFRAGGVRWEERGLRIEELRFESGELTLEARAATWSPDGSWRLMGVVASYGEWRFEFSLGVYYQDREVLEITEDLVARGWGWEVRAEGAEIDIPAKRVVLQGVEVVEA